VNKLCVKIMYAKMIWFEHRVVRNVPIWRKFLSFRVESHFLLSFGNQKYISLLGVAKITIQLLLFAPILEQNSPFLGIYPLWSIQKSNFQDKLWLHYKACRTCHTHLNVFECIAEHSYLLHFEQFQDISILSLNTSKITWFRDSLRYWIHLTTLF
jgi:hypothetical protein